ncbi:hypothetical protein G9A89_002695 [Geosiphon pyriformis]|nr:hypothetical protein G9A89_002695 [Geosiphon pyriformis]
MEPVGLSIEGFGLVLAGLETHLNAKKNCLTTVYSCGTSYKKMKKNVTSVVVDWSVGSLSLEDIGGAGIKPVVMVNTVAKETSYAKSSEDNNMNKAKLKKTHTRTYVLGNPPKQPFFNYMSNDDNELVLPPCVILSPNKLPPIKSRATEKQNFNSSKFFALDIELSADGFGGASTPSKFPEIIKSSFTSKASINKAKELAICEKIVVNNNFKKINSCSDKKIIVKKIPVNLSRLAVEFVFSKFGKIKALVEFELSKITNLVAVRWSVFMGKDSVFSSDQHWALLYILPVGTTAHDLLDLLKSYGGKTCFISHNSSIYVHNKCAIVYFVDKASKLTAIGSILVFKSVNLHWAGFFLACCIHCKQFGHISTECLLGGNSGFHAPIVCPVSFSGKTWAQMASGSSSHVVLLDLSGTDLFSSAKPVSLVSNFLGNSCLVDCLASLKCSLKLLVDQILDILKKLSFVELVPQMSSPHVSLLVVIASVAANVNLDMILDDAIVSPPLSFSVVVDSVADLSLSSSKVLTTKVDGLESKMVALEMSVLSVLDRLDCLCSGLRFDLVWKFAMCNVRDINVSTKQKDIIYWHRDSGNLVSIITKTELRFSSRVFSSGLDKKFLGTEVAVIMNTFLVHHVCKVSEMPGQLLLIRLLFRNKYSVSILGLYAGASLVVWFFQTNEINSFIAKTVNKSSFIVLGGDFNENSA